uniref:DUF1618 domain-containing protein n=1 Tax=Aegilops tauschii subsp. strangulata TaxID=200361 RepID=A0A453DWI5_AEGTS
LLSLVLCFPLLPPRPSSSPSRHKPQSPILGFIPKAKVPGSMAHSTVSGGPDALIGPHAGAAATPPSSAASDWALINNRAHISGDRNATTAVCRTREGQPVEVSFWIADPPSVSHFSVHCPGIDDSDLCSDAPPYIICAEAAFLLFCVTIDESVHHFVYSARGIPAGKPSLHLLPGPCPRVDAFASQQFGILPCGDEHYAVAFLDHQWDSTDQDWHYSVYIFSSETKAWRRSKDALLQLSEPDKLLFDIHSSSKQIAVGANSLGWVDLFRGIVLVCNLFDECPVSRFIPFPTSRASITDAPEYFGDVVCSGDLIKFVCRMKGKGWRATTWERKLSWDDWQQRCTIDVKNVSVDQSFSALLPELLDEETKQLNLKKLSFLVPTLSVHDDNLLYMMAKVVDGDGTPLVIVVDMDRAVLEALVPVYTKPSYTITMYSPCALPKYHLNNKDNAGEGIDNPVDKGSNTQENPQKKRKKKSGKKKKQLHVPDRQPKSYVLCFLGCILIVIIVKVLWPRLSLLV